MSVKVFIRSTPLEGSTFDISSAVFPVIFLISSGRASPYSEIIKRNVFGGGFIIVREMSGYFFCASAI
jgi:hypothetical protein